MHEGFNFDTVGHKSPTKTKKYADDPRQPPETGCDFFNCKRRQNLWPYEFDTQTLWFCWPHYRRYARRTPPYKGRIKHHAFAAQHLERADYTRDERHRHHEFARRFLDGCNLLAS